MERVAPHVFTRSCSHVLKRGSAIAQHLSLIMRLILHRRRQSPLPRLKVLGCISRRIKDRQTYIYTRLITGERRSQFRSAVARVRELLQGDRYRFIRDRNNNNNNAHSFDNIILHGEILSTPGEVLRDMSDS